MTRIQLVPFAGPGVQEVALSAQEARPQDGDLDGGRGLPKASLDRPHCLSAGLLSLPGEQLGPQGISLRLCPKCLGGPADNPR